MIDPSAEAGGPAARAARPGEDLRWRVAARWVQILQLLAAALFVSNAALQAMAGGAGSNGNVGTVLYLIAACAFVVSFFTLGGWTSANRDGLRCFNGLRRHEIRWTEISGIARKRMAITATTYDRRTLTLPGVTQARLGELTHIWSHYRGALEAQRALSHDVRDGLWPVEPSRRFRVPGGVLAVVVLGGSLLLAVFVAVAIVLATGHPFWAVIVTTAVLLIFLVPPIRLTFAGTTLRPEGVRIRLPWRTRTIAWQQVRDVVAAGEYTGLVLRDGSRAILYGIPREQWHVVERMRAAAMQREA